MYFLNQQKKIFKEKCSLYNILKDSREERKGEKKKSSIKCSFFKSKQDNPEKNVNELNALKRGSFQVKNPQSQLYVVYLKHTFNQLTQKDSNPRDGPQFLCICLSGSPHNHALTSEKTTEFIQQLMAINQLPINGIPSFAYTAICSICFCNSLNISLQRLSKGILRGTWGPLSLAGWCPRLKVSTQLQRGQL